MYSQKQAKARSDRSGSFRMVQERPSQRIGNPRSSNTLPQLTVIFSAISSSDLFEPPAPLRRLGKFPDALTAVAHEDDRFHLVEVQNSRHFIESFVYSRTRGGTFLLRIRISGRRIQDQATGMNLCVQPTPRKSPPPADGPHIPAKERHPAKAGAGTDVQCRASLCPPQPDVCPFFTDKF